jgi:hypothetical protein
LIGAALVWPIPASQEQHIFGLTGPLDDDADDEQTTRPRSLSSLFFVFGQLREEAIIPLPQAPNRLLARIHNFCDRYVRRRGPLLVWRNGRRTGLINIGTSHLVA